MYATPCTSAPAAAFAILAQKRALAISRNKVAFVPRRSACGWTRHGYSGEHDDGRLARHVVRYTDYAYDFSGACDGSRFQPEHQQDGYADGRRSRQLHHHCERVHDRTTAQAHVQALYARDVSGAEDSHHRAAREREHPVARRRAMRNMAQ